ncbi:MAG: DUF1501 domain-containing protein [Pseudomonadota bacterium]
MKRRDLIKLGGMAGLAAGTTIPVRAKAATPFAGPYWLMISASGGWDPTSFCDPKGRGLGPNGDCNDYAQGDVGSVGNFRYAPPPDSFPGGGGLFPYQEFLINHFERLALVNGINVGTNSHRIGQQTNWTGTKTVNYPSIGALVAARYGSDQPLPFVANNVHPSAATAGLVPRAVVSGGGLNSLREVALPERSNVFNANASERYLSEAIWTEVQAVSADRRNRQQDARRLVRIQDAMRRLGDIREVDTSGMQDFVERLGTPATPNTYVDSRNDARNLFNQAQRAFAAFEAGITVAAQVNVGGFDTHNEHDAGQYPHLMDYFGAIDNVIQDAIDRGLGDRLIIVMASDFSRRPFLNNNNGKDHWSTGSVMVWGAPAFVTGNRVVGETDDGFLPQPLDPATLLADNDGMVLTTEHVHQALRRIAGINSGDALDSQYSLGVDALDLFT